MCLVEEDSRIQEEMVNTDMAMRIMVPGTEAIKPTVQSSPRPAGFKEYMDHGKEAKYLKNYLRHPPK